MSEYYDPQPYRQTRRTGDLKYQNSKASTQPHRRHNPESSHYMPEIAGARVYLTFIMVFSDERQSETIFRNSDTSLSAILSMI